MYVRDFFFAGSGCRGDALLGSLAVAVVCELWFELPPLAPDPAVGFDENVDLKNDMLLLCPKQEHIRGAVLGVPAQLERWG